MILGDVTCQIFGLNGLFARLFPRLAEVVQTQGCTII